VLVARTDSVFLHRQNSLDLECCEVTLGYGKSTGGVGRFKSPAVGPERGRMVRIAH
jgi:hypothetical protein